MGADADPADPLDRRIVGLALLALGTLAVEPLYVPVDSVVGRLGTAQLAALGVAATVLLVALAVTDVLEIGVTPQLVHAPLHALSDDRRALSSPR